MADRTIFEDFLWIYKARDERSILGKEFVLTLLNRKEVSDKKISELREEFIEQTLEEKVCVVMQTLSKLRGLKYDLGELDSGKLYCSIKTQDAWKSELYVTPDDYLQYEIRMSSGWVEKTRQDYLDLELSKKTDAIELFNDLKIFREKGVSFEDAGKILDKKYHSITLYRPQKRTHYLEGVLSASVGILSTPNEVRELTDYCLSLELSQVISDNGQKNVKAVLTVDTKWNFIKK